MRCAMPLVAMTVAALLAGCQWLNLDAPGPVGPGGQKGAVEVIIHYADGQPVRQMVEIAGSPSVLDVTERAARVQTDFAPSGEQRVVAIGGQKNDPANGKLWVYEVNNVPQSAVANLRYVNSGDVIHWRYK